MRQSLSTLGAAVALTLAAPPWSAATTTATDVELRALLARYAPAVVGVKAVIKTEVQMAGQGRDQENTLDTLGVVVDPGGLIMISNTQISARRIAEIMAAVGGPSDFDFTLTPTAFTVFFAGDDEGRPALLAAVDTQLDLAFLQLETPPETPLAAVDLTKAAEPAVGQEVVLVSRLDQSFGYSPYCELVRVAGEVRKPRLAWVLDGEVSGLGLPAFDPAGVPVGVISTVVSTVGSETAAGRGGVGGLFAGLNRRKTLGPVGVFLLPVAPVAKAVELSRERSRELLRERKEGDGEREDSSAEAPVGKSNPATESQQTGGGAPLPP